MYIYLILTILNSLNFLIVGGSIRIKTYSYFTNISILNNVFDKGFADWGSVFDLEVCFSVYSANNLFLNGIALSYFGNGVGTGSFMIMSGGTDLRYSSYVGFNNKYMFGCGESRGFLKNKVKLLKNKRHNGFVWRKLQ